MAKVEISRPGSAGTRRIWCDGQVVGTVMPVAYRQWEVTGREIGKPSVETFCARFGRLDHALSFAREYAWPRQRWIYMSGSYGCLPDSSGCAETRDSAIESLVELFSLGGRRARSLRRSDYLELSPRRDGAEYCEVVPCECLECRNGSDGDGCCDA